jgi:tRNA threonylcarbamoyladenosine modification (KEOPS) complex Cgi121 subunit
MQWVIGTMQTLTTDIIDTKKLTSSAFNHAVNNKTSGRNILPDLWRVISHLS